MKLMNGRSAALLAAVMAAVCVGCASKTVGNVNDPKPDPNTGEVVTTEPTTEEVTTEPIPEDKRVHVIAAGDNLIHYSVYKNAERHAGVEGQFDFKPIYAPVKYLIEEADLAILNQETIISQSNGIRGANDGALLFNSPPEVADAVIDLGFDVFTMANNHLLDFGADALEESIRFWNDKAEKNDLTVLGAYLNQEDADNIRVREVNGVKIAFLAYAEHINGFENNPYFIESPLRVVMNYEEDVIERQIKEAKELADVVIVAAHWGVEDVNYVSEDRVILANKMVNWGADVILGGHTHTAETMEWITREDGSKGFVYYSIGNFICCQTDNFNLVGEMPDFDIVMNGVTGEITLENVGCIPNIIHYESPDFANLAVYPYSKYTPEMAAAHGVPYAFPRGTYPDFNWDIMNDIINQVIPEEFRKLDK